MYTEEQLKFIRKTIKTHTLNETTLLFNRKFNRCVSINVIAIICSRKKWKTVNSLKNRLTKEKKINNDHVIQKLADFYYTDYFNMDRMLMRQKINPYRLFKLLNSEDLIHRRDEFYSLFRSENSADHYWTGIWESGRREIK